MIKLTALLAAGAVLAGCVVAPPPPPPHRGPPPAYGDRDRDGVPNRYDRDRDNDGVPNRYDRRPNDPYRRGPVKRKRATGRPVPMRGLFFLHACFVVKT